MTMETTETTKGSPRIRALVVLGTVFLVGALAGAATHRAVGGSRAIGALPLGECQGAGGDPEDHPLLQRLDLGSDQRPRVEEIIRKRHGQITALWEEVQPRVSAIMDTTRAELDVVLTPHQRAVRDSIRDACGGGALRPR